MSYRIKTCIQQANLTIAIDSSYKAALYKKSGALKLGIEIERVISCKTEGTWNIFI